MKGISPLVATVFLVALVIAIFGLVSLFANNLFTTSTGITSNQSTTQTKCAGVTINVWRVTNTTVFYSNPSSQNITGITVVMGDGSTNACASGSYIAPSASNSTTIGNSTCGATGVIPGGATGNTSITVKGLCQSIQPVEGTCKQGQGCWAT